ncbi:MAG: hypothetical protein KKD44_02975 [Proteobacteria bacterium]|nr:hypothetical protein [Pseudomonadota bacterium]
MRYFPFKMLLLCIFLPPFLYISSAKWVERALESNYTQSIEKTCTGDIKPLLDGRSRLKDVLNKNIDGFLTSRNPILMDIRTTVMVSTKKGQLLYPQSFDEDSSLLNSSEPLRIAENNFKLLNEGLSVKVTVNLDPNSYLSYLMLSGFMIFSALLFYFFYRAGMKKSQEESEEKQKEWTYMLEKDRENRDALEILSQNRTELVERLDDMKKKLSEVNRSEDGMIEEIVSLEQKIEQNEQLQKKQQEEIETLKAAIDDAKLDKGKKSRQNPKGYDFIGKRFKTVYKNLSFHDRAVEGYLDLEETMKLKCEEVIHQLNDEPDQVIIKRKVFGKKNRETVFEVIFAYKGRIYFRRLKDNTIEVLAVGTKNTQDRELDFLDRL